MSTCFMNSSGWLLGGTTALVLIGCLSIVYGPGEEIILSATGYGMAALLLFAASWRIRRAHTFREQVLIAQV